MEGKIIGGYKVIRLLGQGTFGQTLLVEKNDTKYALKMFRKEMIRNEGNVRRINREIQALQSINHPNVVRYIDDGVYNEGYNQFHYLVMEFADGLPLSNLISHQGRVTVQITQRIGIQILEGIRAIHKAGFYHRDLKPDNIFVTSKVKLGFSILGWSKF